MCLASSKTSVNCILCTIQAIESMLLTEHVIDLRNHIFNFQLLVLYIEYVTVFCDPITIYIQAIDSN